MKPRRGRPLSLLNQVRLDSGKMWAESRPAFAVDSQPSDMLQHLVTGDAFKTIRKGLGLAHKTIPDDLVIDELRSMEGATDEFINATNERLSQKRSEIRMATKKGGGRLPVKNLRRAIGGHVESSRALHEFFERKISYKALCQNLDALGLCAPAERTLLRWKNSEIGH